LSSGQGIPPQVRSARTPPRFEATTDGFAVSFSLLGDALIVIETVGGTDLFGRKGQQRGTVESLTRKMTYCAADWVGVTVIFADRDIEGVAELDGVLDGVTDTLGLGGVQPDWTRKY